jgi:hypothetical protein
MCKNFISGDVYPHTWKCKAFPNGLPEKKIMFLTHDTCENCNNGIGFEPENKQKNND